MSKPTVTVEQTRHTVTVEDSGQRVTVPNEIVRIITAGTQGPPGPPSLSPDGIITTEGGIIVGGSGGTPAELAVGADAHALVSNGITRVNRRLAAWDVTWSGATAYEMSDADGVGGTAHGSMVNAAAALQAANDKAALLGLPLVGNGRYRVDSLVTFTVPFDFANAEFVCNDTALDPLIRVGTATSGARIRNLRGYLPRIVQLAKTGTGWVGTSCGVELSNLYQSKIWGNRIRNFTTGLRLRGIGTGCVYNDIFPGHLDNNKINLNLQPGTGGWTNQNEFYGGRVSHDGAEGTLVAGLRHILLEDTGLSGPNGNSFYGTSIEGAVPEYTVESISGVENVWLGCRWESTSNARVFWNQSDPTRPSRNNLIIGGYNAHTIVFTAAADAVSNGLISTLKMVIDGADATLGVMRARNRSSSGIGILRGFDLATNPLTAGSNDWTFDLSAGHLRGKNKVHANPVLFLSFLNTNGIDFGDGTNAPDTRVRRSAANVFSTADDDSMRAGAGAWNTGHLIMGAYHLWIDATGALRVKSSAPTSDTDGVTVGSQ